jgi:hypothetical protein
MTMRAALADTIRDPSAPLTSVLQDAFPRIRDRSAQADLLFLERWEIAPQAGTGLALRVQQIRRANPELAAAIRAEIARLRSAPPLMR